MLIAIVDDDSSMQCLLQAAQEHAGHQVRLFPDAHSFLDPGCNPDLGMLVVDWLLPDMQGPELVRADRDVDPDADRRNAQRRLRQRRQTRHRRNRKR